MLGSILPSLLRPNRFSDVDSFLDFVCQILLDNDIQEKVQALQLRLDAATETRFMDDNTWKQLLETIREAFERWKAQAIKRNAEKEYVLEAGNNTTTL